jgi:hypothetical protein
MAAGSRREPIDWYRSAARLHRMVAGVVDIAVLIEDVATTKVRLSFFVGFTHHAASLLFLGFVHVLPPQEKNLNESSICQVSGAV